MVYLLNCRRNTFVCLIVFFTFVAFASGQAWIPWVTLVIFLGLLFITDLLFLNDSDFKYDPDYKNWARQNDPKY